MMYQSNQNSNFYISLVHEFIVKAKVAEPKYIGD